MSSAQSSVTRLEQTRGECCLHASTGLLIWSKFANYRGKRQIRNKGDAWTANIFVKLQGGPCSHRVITLKSQYNQSNCSLLTFLIACFHFPLKTFQPESFLLIWMHKWSGKIHRWFVTAITCTWNVFIQMGVILISISSSKLHNLIAFLIKRPSSWI